MTRAAGYLRVSTDMQREGYSIAAQERALTDACSQRGYDLVAIHRDEGISARSERIEARPGLVALLQMVEAGQVDIVVIHSLDRLSRNVLVMLQVFKRLAAHNVAFVSLSEALDYSSPEGKLQLTVLAAFSSYFSDNLAKHVAKGMHERVAQGLHGGRAPLGYTTDDKHNLIVDPASSDAVRGAFAAYAAGASSRALVIRLSAAGYPVRRSGVYYILNNRTYIGQVRYRDTWLPGHHERLVDDATWQACQVHLATNRRLQNGPTGRLKLFSGLLRCARCGGPVQAGSERDGSLLYQCARRRDQAACDAPASRETTLAAQMPGILAQLVIDDATVARMAAQQPKPVPVDRDALNARLERLRLTYELADISRERYLSRRAEIVRERDAVDLTPVVDYAAVAETVRNLVALWQDGTRDERRQVLTALWRDILVDGRIIVAVQPQAPLVPLVHGLWLPHERPGFYVLPSR